MLDRDAVFFSELKNYNLAAGVVARLPATWKANLDLNYGWSQSVFRQNAGLPAAFTTAVQTGAIDVLRDTFAYPIDMATYGGSYVASTLLPASTVSKGAALRAAGPLFNLPAGPMGLSALVEIREEAISEGTRSSSVSFPYIWAPDRSQLNYSEYLETKLPIFGAANRKFLLEELELQFAVRHDNYTTDGATTVIGTGTTVRGTNRVSSTDPTVALRWVPVKDVAVRASYGTGFLPPATNQLTGSTAAAAQTVIDPRRGNTSISVPATQILTGGSPDLKPEKSKTWSTGVIFTPRVLPGFRLSADYTQIEKIDNLTNLFAAQPIVDNEAFLAERVTRGANLPGDPAGWAGPITAVDARILNLAKAELEALDLDASYLLRTQTMGEFEFAAAATRTFHYKTQTTPLAAVVESVGTNPATGAPLPWKGNASMSWRKGAWAAGWVTRYFDAYLIYLSSSNAATKALNVTNQGNGGWVDSQTFHDCWASYRFGPGGSDGRGWKNAALGGLEITVGIKNVFNKEPALDARGVNSITYSQQGDARLAVYYITLKKSL